eukprot:4136094-Pyramimonas_sp.AAC.1
MQLRGAFVAGMRSQADAAQWCRSLGAQLLAEWSKHRADKAFATLRRMGVGPKKRMPLRSPPIVRHPSGAPASDSIEEVDIWLRHFGMEEL